MILKYTEILVHNFFFLSDFFREKFHPYSINISLKPDTKFENFRTSR